MIGIKEVLKFFKKYIMIKILYTGSTGYVDVVDVANCSILLLQSDIKNERFIVNGENLKYRDVFNWIVDGFGKKRPSIKVTPFLKEIVWRTEYILSIITGKKVFNHKRDL